MPGVLPPASGPWHSPEAPAWTLILSPGRAQGSRALRGPPAGPASPLRCQRTPLPRRSRPSSTSNGQMRTCHPGPAARRRQPSESSTASAVPDPHRSQGKGRLLRAAWTWGLLERPPGGAARKEVRRLQTFARHSATGQERPQGQGGHSRGGRAQCWDRAAARPYLSGPGMEPASTLSHRPASAPQPSV